eukprot:GEMP01026661.1.p1 GENE.GEMP01026661.1~~GEMP01026661.1.p1  ORF type:complete len:355 (+),score=68.52 GEMP01026661.1:518-1582(+)
MSTDPDVDADGRRRINGFDLPLHPLQVASWVVFGADVLVFAIFCLPLMEDLGVQIACYSIFGISVVSISMNTFWATQRDPVDRNVLESPRQNVDQSDMPFCTRCNSYVFARSKHCKLCHKCVDIFDHHCKWMNTCVGKGNYLYFILSITSVTVMTAVQSGVCTYLLYENVTGDEVSERAVRVFGHGNTKSLTALFASMLIVNVPILYLNTQLVILHIYLQHRDLTTYEYIMTKRSQQIGTPAQRDVRVSTSSKYEVCEMGDDQYPGHQVFSPQGRSLKNGIRTLPTFLDWFVYQSKGNRGRRIHAENSDNNNRIVAQTIHVDVVMAKAHDHVEQIAFPVGNGLPNADDEGSSQV